MEAWAHRVRVSSKISQQHPHSAYAGLGMSLKLEWQYLQRNVPEVGAMVGPIEEALNEKFFPELFRGRRSTPTFVKSESIVLSMAS